MESEAKTKGTLETRALAFQSGLPLMHWGPLSRPCENAGRDVPALPRSRGGERKRALPCLPCCGSRGPGRTTPFGPFTWDQGPRS